MKGSKDTTLTELKKMVRNANTCENYQILFSGTCAHLFYETRVGLTSQRFRHVRSARFGDDLGFFKVVLLRSLPELLQKYVET